jgi:hypothetical protein
VSPGPDPGVSGPGVVASAPGRLPLAGGANGPRLSLALDRRTVCRAETREKGILIESKDGLVRTAAGDVTELLSKNGASLAAHALRLLGAETGLQLVTESKIAPGSGLDGEAALALAIVAAAARALDCDPGPDGLVRLAREAAARAGRPVNEGYHEALWGGAVVTRGTGEQLTAEPLQADPGRIEESLLLVDVGAGLTAPEPRAGNPPATDRLLAALVAGRFEEAVDWLTEEWGGEPGPSAAERPDLRVVAIVRGAGGAARPLGEGRLVVAWAPPGARGPGRREAVQGALRGAGLRLVPFRLDLRGLELD